MHFSIPSSSVFSSLCWCFPSPPLMFPFSYARLFLNLYTCFCYRVQMFSFWCTPSWKKVYTFSNLAVHLFEFWCTPFCSLSALVRQNISARSTKHQRSFDKTSPLVRQNITVRSAKHHRSSHHSLLFLIPLSSSFHPSIPHSPSCHSPFLVPPFPMFHLKTYALAHAIIVCPCVRVL